MERSLETGRRRICGDRDVKGDITKLFEKETWLCTGKSIMSPQELEAFNQKFARVMLWDFKISEVVKCKDGYKCVYLVRESRESESGMCVKDTEDYIGIAIEVAKRELGTCKTVETAISWLQPYCKYKYDNGRVIHKDSLSHVTKLKCSSYYILVVMEALEYLGSINKESVTIEEMLTLRDIIRKLPNVRGTTSFNYREKLEEILKFVCVSGSERLRALGRMYVLWCMEWDSNDLMFDYVWSSLNKGYAAKAGCAEIKV